jgi:peptidase A4-like protein
MTRHRHRFLLYCLTAIVPAVGMLSATAATASAQTTTAVTARPSPAAEAQALAKAAIEKLAVGQHPLNHHVGVTSPAGKPEGLTNVQSTNWSGYADTGSSFSKVSASWTEPSATCSSRSEQLAAFWVGIDGYSSNSVEQDGTLIECYQRVAYQYTWWEMYPTNDIQVVGETLAAGDAITSTVTRSGTNYTLSVTDSTHTADSFTETETCSSCANTSAEWIAEAPSSSSSVYPLADFGSWTASSASVTEGSTSGGISSFTDDEITMINSSGQTKALPGSLNSSGSSFPVTWERSS